MGRTDVEAEATILWPPDAKSWLIWKDPDAGKDWRWEEKGMTEDEMVFLCVAVRGVVKSQTWLSDWTELNWTETVTKKWSILKAKLQFQFDCKCYVFVCLD